MTILNIAGIFKFIFLHFVGKIRSAFIRSPADSVRAGSPDFVDRSMKALYNNSVLLAKHFSINNSFRRGVCSLRLTERVARIKEGFCGRHGMLSMPGKIGGPKDGFSVYGL
jgi:hypothetical protein